MIEQFGFEKALEMAKKGMSVSRVIWPDHIKVMVQMPNTDSKMTKPYLFMSKLENDVISRFPLDLSAESIFAEDWYVTD